jgi:hypothetical protein
MRHLAALVSAALCLALAAPAGAQPFPDSIPLPDDFAPEGIATGAGTTFYAGSITLGDIYRGDLRTGEGAIFIDAPAGRSALGLKADRRHGLLFVHFGAPGASLVNDVIVTRDAAYFTDSFAPVLYVVPIGPGGELGSGETLALSGPATTVVPGEPGLNGIEATRDGKALIVNHTALGALFTVDPLTGESTAIDVVGLTAGTLDGLLLHGHDLWVVENFPNTLARVSLSPDLSSGEITATITSPLFRVPTTIARHGSRLAAVNARFDLGFPPPLGPGAPPGTDFDVVLVRAR